MKKVILNHFKKVDPILAQVITEIGEVPDFEKKASDLYFLDLVESIVSQQLSGKAASTIFGRFVKLIPDGKVTPENILKMKDEDIREAGISYSKIKYIKDLAEKVQSGELDLLGLEEMEDEVIITELTKVKGIGRWTAEMFLMFALAREDVFSHGDLGLNNAIKRIYKLENPSKEEIEIIVEKWKPFRSYAARVLWKSLNNRPK